MKIVRLQDAKTNVPPKHFNMVSLELHGMEPQGFHNLLILGQSQFLPGGGCEGGEMMADVIYYILDGTLTVKTGADTDIQHITGATVTSAAVTDGVNIALAFIAEGGVN